MLWQKFANVSELDDQEPFKCQHCDKNFDEAIELRDHERIHTQEKTFDCHNCNTNFEQDSEVERP